MKKTLLIGCCLVFLAMFPCRAQAAWQTEADKWCPGLWESIDAETRGLLEQMGVEGVRADSFLNLSPDRVFAVIGGIVKGEAASPARYGAAVILVIVLTAFAAALMPENGAMRSRCETVGHLCGMFVMLSGAGQALYESMSAVTATEDFMVLLIPAFTGVLGFAGNPALALSWGGAVLAFAETVTAFFARFIPAAASLGAAVCAAANLNAESNFSGAAKLFAKAVTTAMGFAAGIFTAVLSVKDVIAAAADNVGIKGMKFVVGQGVPILGSAIADTLNSVAAGLAMVRNTVAVFALLALALINLLPVVRLLLWKFVFLFCATAGRVMNRGRLAELAECLNSLLSVILSVICFNGAVFVIALALVVNTGRR